MHMFAHTRGTRYTINMGRQLNPHIFKDMSFAETIREARRAVIVGALRRNVSVAAAFRDIDVPHRTGWSWVSKLEIPYEHEIGREI